MVQRGNPNLLKSIQKSAKKVSESRGVSSGMKINTPTPQSIPEAGAFASIQKMNSTHNMNKRVYVTEGGNEKRLKDRLLESVEMLGTTGEYFNATSSLLSLYAMGELTEGVMRTISREDLNEIKGIIREFKSMLDSY